MSAQFTPGQTAYDRNGRKLYFRRDLGDGTAIVSRWLATETWEGDTEQYVSEEPVILSGDGLYLSPPTEALSAEVAEFAEQITDAHNVLSSIIRQTREAEAEQKRVMAAVVAVEPLRNIERFLAGEITHFVVVSEAYSGEFYGGVAIETFEQAITQFDTRGRADGMKLLSLFGNSKGDLAFRINSYGEGSGSWRRVIPCLSLEEAVSKASEFLDRAWASFGATAHHHRLCESIKSADAIGVPVPASIREAWDAQVLAALQANVDKAETDLVERRAALAKARGEQS